MLSTVFNLRLSFIKHGTQPNCISDIRRNDNTLIFRTLLEIFILYLLLSAVPTVLVAGNYVRPGNELIPGKMVIGRENKE